MMPGSALNCLRTSSTMRPAARPTACIDSPQNTKAMTEPMNAPTRTRGFIRVMSK